MLQRLDITMKPRQCMVLLLVVAALMAGWVHGLSAQPRPAGEMVIAWHVTLAPAWFDPAETPAQITPFGLLYALHDALVRPRPGELMGNSLAESWTESPDGLVYEFTLRPGLRFHNGDPCTAEDVQFSFARYKGTGAKELHANVQRVEIVGPLTLRFHLKAPWPDFMTFYGTTATAAGIVVPKHYLEQVGEDGFKHHPIGLGPYKFVSHRPGVEVVLEAYEGRMHPGREHRAEKSEGYSMSLSNPAVRPQPVPLNGQSRCAGINRQEVGNARVPQERHSEPS